MDASTHSIYTSIEEARSEIWRRWNDHALKAAVEEYVAGIPPCFDQPRAVLFRNIISATTELALFMEQARAIGLRPLGAEYLEDVFCTRNADKLMLIKLRLITGTDRRGQSIFINRYIADVKENDNKTFSMIKTHDGEALASFHHRRVRNNFGAIEIVDFSRWIENNGKHSAEYYKKFLALFLCHGVLFETFVTNKAEDEFARSVVLPAFEQVLALFGMQPLIVRNLPTPEDIYWLCYPANPKNNELDSMRGLTR